MDWEASRVATGDRVPPADVLVWLVCCSSVAVIVARCRRRVHNRGAARQVGRTSLRLPAAGCSVLQVLAHAWAVPMRAGSREKKTVLSEARGMCGRCLAAVAGVAPLALAAAAAVAEGRRPAWAAWTLDIHMEAIGSTSCWSAVCKGSPHLGMGRPGRRAVAPLGARPGLHESAPRPGHGRGWLELPSHPPTRYATSPPAHTGACTMAPPTLPGPAPLRGLTERPRRACEASAARGPRECSVRDGIATTLGLPLAPLAKAPSALAAAPRCRSTLPPHDSISIVPQPSHPRVPLLLARRACSCSWSLLPSLGLHLPCRATTRPFALRTPRPLPAALEQSSSEPLLPGTGLHSLSAKACALESQHPPAPLDSRASIHYAVDGLRAPETDCV
ncbi:hypothetical protein T440DRAFT_482691 [Plenodomus tracheiphilus IPT5]|uniref:Uncharacterized protein n=1 Tax=Plenodomus tracheiphilus IPT5 TaxID=1408161 RepID=A0A6A7AVX6_9PLEO|nr:hypothetical protein T440DRAFT_482691 [Plenodomus tracheiphilus IPT5]